MYTERYKALHLRHLAYNIKTVQHSIFTGFLGNTINAFNFFWNVMYLIMKNTIFHIISFVDVYKFCSSTSSSIQMNWLINFKHRFLNFGPYSFLKIYWHEKYKNVCRLPYCLLLSQTKSRINFPLGQEMRIRQSR